MTETEWLSSTDPPAMLRFLGQRAGEKMRRLFYSACCRRIWSLMTDARARQAVEAAELFAEGLISAAQLHCARMQARYAVCAAKAEELDAELEANFRYTPAYCATGVKLFANCAALAAASPSAMDAHGGWELHDEPETIDVFRMFDPLRASDYWAAAALGDNTHGELLSRGPTRTRNVLPTVTIARSEWLDEFLRQSNKTFEEHLFERQVIEARRIAKQEEMAQQARLLRCLVHNC